MNKGFRTYITWIVCRISYMPQCDCCDDDDKDDDDVRSSLIDIEFMLKVEKVLEIRDCAK